MPDQVVISYHRLKIRAKTASPAVCGSCSWRRQHGIDRVTMKPLQKAAAQMVVLLEMHDLGFDRTATLAALLHGSALVTRGTADKVNGH